MEKKIAVIEIGISFVEMVIYEKKTQNFKILERVKEEIDFFRNIHEKMEISFEKSKKLCEILKKMKTLSKDYEIEKIELIMVEGFKKIENLPLILDQISLYADLQIKEEDFDKNKNIMAKKLLMGKKNIFEKKESSFFMNIESFTSDFYIFYKGNLTINESLDLGPYKLYEIIFKENLTSEKSKKFIEDYVRNSFEFLKKEVGRKKISTLVLSGELELNCLKKILKTDDLSCITKEDFKKSLKKLEYSSFDEISRNYQISNLKSKITFITLSIINSFVDFFDSEKICFLDLDSKDILALESFYPLTKLELEDKIWKITKESVIDLGIKNNFNLENANLVLDISEKMFEKLKDFHKLEEKYRHYLIVASYLHDIGKFISFKEHSKHSCYIFENSYIFGLNEEDIKNIVFLIYAHSHNISLIDLYKFEKNREDFVRLLKIAAILKIAVSLNRSKKQKIKKWDIQLEKNILNINVESKEDFFI
ncbi:MAG: HD domain-containing protein, partial [Fusobacteriaceae bacterium]